MTDYNDGKWYGWNGGECPVHPKTIVQVRFALRLRESNDGMEFPAGSLLWSHNNLASDIIVFRVVKEHRHPREFWLTSCGIYHSKSAAMEANPPGEVVHVREVTE